MADTAKHTPGPWRMNGYGHIVCYPESLETGVLASNLPDGEKEANAILIVAAPDLLEALKEATLALDGLAKGEGVFKPIEQTVKACLAAIAKAEGRS